MVKQRNERKLKASELKVHEKHSRIQFNIPQKSEDNLE
jgi:hypothetical protein